MNHPHPVNAERPWLAVNARRLLHTRKQGYVPEGPVVVSLVGQEFGETALYVHADMPTERMDWRMLVNLPVWVWASTHAALDWTVATVWNIARARPSELMLRFEHGAKVHDIDCGTGIHQAAVPGMAAEHLFFWLPVNVGGTRQGRRLTNALTAAHPKGKRL